MCLTWNTWFTGSKRAHSHGSTRGSNAPTTNLSVTASNFQNIKDKYADQPPVKLATLSHIHVLETSWNVMAHAQKPEFVFRRNGRVHLNRRGRQLSRLLAAEECASAVVMMDTPCSEVVWRVLATHSVRQFPLIFSSRASPCAITFQLESTSVDSSWFETTYFSKAIYMQGKMCNVTERGL
jgi:hypothetical protein